MNRKTCFKLAGLFLLGAGLLLAAEGTVEVVKDVPSTYLYPCGGFLPFNIHRGTQTMLSLMLPGCSFNDPRGVACALLKKDHDPGAPQNDVVVTCVGVNSGAAEIVYNVGLKDLRRFGSPGHGEKEFFAPNGVAIHSNGNVAVADTGNNRIALLRHDGMRISWVKSAGKRGSLSGEFISPMGVAYDSQGRLYIADTGNNRIQVMDAKGRIRVLSTPPLEGPSALAVIDSKEDWTFYQQGPYADRIAVIDRHGTRLQTLSLEGAPLTQTASDPAAASPVKLWGCAFDYYGNVIATDFSQSCLRKFDKDLHYVVSFGSAGEGDFKFLEPRGIAFNHQFGQVLVADKECVHYFWNGTDAVDLTTEPSGQGFKFHYHLTERAIVTSEIRDSQGKTIKTLDQGKDLEEGIQVLDWIPEPTVPKGDYTLFLRLMATYSSRDRIAKEINLPVSYQ